MTDPRAMLQDIKREFAANNARWIKREVGNAQHALDDTAHEAALEALMGVICENWEALADVHIALPVATVDRAEVESPGR